MEPKAVPMIWKGHLTRVLHLQGSLMESLQKRMWSSTTGRCRRPDAMSHTRSLTHSGTWTLSLLSRMTSGTMSCPG